MMTRRRWLLLSATVGASAGAVLLPWSRIANLPMARWFAPSTGLSPSVDAMLIALDGTSRVGRAWLATEGEGMELSTLVDRLLERLGDAESRADMEMRLAAQVRGDFEEGRTCEIDGWRLAQTECELAGLRLLVFGTLAVRQVEEEEARQPTQVREGHIVEVTNWGPRSTEQGIPFSVQPNGLSGFWISAENAASWIQVLVDGESAVTSVLDKVITCHLPIELGDRILASPGTYRLELYDPVTSLKQRVGEFEVRPAAERALLADGSRAAALCPVSAWGPESTRAGEPANAQPDGSMGMWFRTLCAPRNARLQFGDDRLPVTRTDFGLTARVPLALIEAPGEVEVRILDGDTGEALLVGMVSIFVD